MILAGRALLHNACGFERRVLASLREFPHKVLLMVRKDARSRCEIRMEVANEVLCLKSSELEINTRKLRERHLEAFKTAAVYGTLPSRLFWLIKGISIHFKSDVRECERLNKQLTLMADRCPTSTTELKSARLGLKYMLGQSGEGSSSKPASKWSEIRPVAESVRNMCLNSWDSLLEVQAQPGRFSPTQPAADCESLQKALYLQSKLKPHVSTHSVQYVWAASYNMLAHRAVKPLLETDDMWQKMLPAVFCIAIRKKSAKASEFHFYVSAEICWRKHIVLPACWNKQTNTISWQELSGFRPLVQLIKEQYDAVKSGDSVLIMHAAVTSFGCTKTGSVSCAKVGKVTTLVKLEAPTQAFVQKCAGHSGDPDSNNDQGDSSARKKQKPERSGARASAASEMQSAGLNLLVEEAEAKARGSHDGEFQADDDSDSADDFQPGGGFEFWCAQGVASAFGQHEGDDVELERAGPQDKDMDAAVISEERAALKAIDEKTVLEQAAFVRLQQNPAMDMDPIDAAVECVVASSSGVDAMQALGQTETGFAEGEGPEEGFLDWYSQ